MADKKEQDTKIEKAKRFASEDASTDPTEAKIEKDRKALKIPTPEDFDTAAKRQALVRLNTKNSTRDDNAVDTAKKYAKETKAKPFVYKKGGKVKKGGIALVHTGEKVLTKSQQKSGGNMKRISCKR
jgi:hypothetical protein